MELRIWLHDLNISGLTLKKGLKKTKQGGNVTIVEE